MGPMQAKEHWESVYTTKAPQSVSWFQEHATRSLELIRGAATSRDAPIIDVGGGASTLVDDLLGAGYTNLTVLDLSGAALSAARTRLGPSVAQKVTWLEADVTQVQLPAHGYEVWHDRAVFHFLTSEDARSRYVEAVRRTVKPGGHLIVATFAEDGPTQCSGLPVVRYGPAQLHAQFGEPFVLVSHLREAHRTPFGTLQQFLYCHCRRRP
jgi:ubiquinone/menaquinone biosynthesis C-methylase UbiE